MRKIFSLGMFMTLAFALAVSGPIFRPIFSVDAQKGATDIDVQHYKIAAELIPASQLLKARAEVRFVPQSETRSVVFEMNGSLTINRITRVDESATTSPAPLLRASAGSVSNRPRRRRKMQARSPH